MKTGRLSEAVEAGKMFVHFVLLAYVIRER